MKINAKQLISKCQYHEKKYKHNFKKLRMYLNGEWSENLVENINRFIPSMYVCTKCEIKELKDQVQRHLNSIEEAAWKKLTSLLDDKKVNEESIIFFINNEIVPYYRGRFNMKYSRELSFLPLLLRLKVYAMMYEVEDDALSKWHIRDRIMVIAAKLEEFELANRLAIINWFEQIGQDDHNTDFHFMANLQFINEAKETRVNLLKKQDYRADHPLDEMSHSLSGLLDLDMIHNKQMAIIVLELLNIYYPFISHNEFYNTVRAFLETENKELLENLEVEIKKVPLSFNHYIVNAKNQVEAISNEMTEQFDHFWEEQIKKYIKSKNKNFFSREEVNKANHEGTHHEDLFDSKVWERERVKTDQYRHLPYFDGLIFEGYIDSSNKEFIWTYFHNHEINFSRLNKSNLQNLKNYAFECVRTGQPFIIKGETNQIWSASHPIQIQSCFEELSSILEQTQ
ncbi:MAG: hypothetical protein O2U61_01825 [Candidatus Bathyarchaeota archaeon]|nr:hypothetical protein [Candidatus Bathyarchaeota archaeon]